MARTAKAPPFPPGPLLGAGVVIAITLLAITFARQTGSGLSQMDDAPVVESRELTFAGRPDGAIAVHDAKDGRLIEVATPSDGKGFVAVAVRGMTFDRQKIGASEGGAFRLSKREDGRLLLEDPSTGKRLDLAAFGHENKAAFASLLPSGSRE